MTETLRKLAVFADLWLSGERGHAMAYAEDHGLV